MNEQIKETCDQLFVDIEIMIRNAVLKEREKCAKLVEEFDLPFIAGAIRERSE